MMKLSGYVVQPEMVRARFGNVMIQFQKDG